LTDDEDFEELLSSTATVLVEHASKQRTQINHKIKRIEPPSFPYCSKFNFIIFKKSRDRSPKDCFGPTGIAKTRESNLNQKNVSFRA
jgi:hypothetical protein